MTRIKIAAACSTNTGKVRLKNEDNFYFNGNLLSSPAEGKSWFSEYVSKESLQLFGVFDGMGGEYCGDVASFTAASRFAKMVKHISEKPQYVDVLIKNYIREVNDEICKDILKNGGRRMGTTLSALCIHGDEMHIYNIGDSRIYRFRNNILEQLSVDHTEIQSLLKMNLIKPEEAKAHPLNHRLTQHLGIFEEELMIEPHFINTSAEIGDKLLLCSDGLTDMVSEDFIKNVLASDISPGACVKSLTEQALNNGGRDNVTVIEVEVLRQKSSVFNTIARLFGI